MGDTDFSTERLLEQARGNQSAIFLLAVRWARERDGSVDGWANFLGSQFAEGWASLRGGAALEVARMAGLNFASSADSKFVRVEGDSSRAEAVIDGPDPQWLEETGVSIEDNDRANELIFARIADYLGMSFEAHRDADGLHLTFSQT
ncbi:MAG: hypothetical protein H0W81_01745 [Chloroflexi bacterium]|nr:hypothetical protein [Chloroflexota bacterium]